MRKLIAGTFLTVDGIMQAPGGPEEDPSGGFPHGGWGVPYFDDRLGEAMVNWISRAGGFLLGFALPVLSIGSANSPSRSSVRVSGSAQKTAKQSLPTRATRAPRSQPSTMRAATLFNIASPYW